MQFFVRRTCTMIAAPIQGDVDGIPKGSHHARLPAMHDDDNLRTACGMWQSVTADASGLRQDNTKMRGLAEIRWASGVVERRHSMPGIEPGPPKLSPRT